jgi:drug/metabolite transporter (DMT)-like permease
VTRKGQLLFVAMCVIWGVPYLLIKVAVRHLTAADLVFARTSIGAVLLVPLAVARKELRPALQRWKPLLFYTVVEIAGPWYLVSTAEKRLSSSMAGLLVATVPLVGAVISRLFRDHEPLGFRVIIGLVVGLVGVAALVGIDVGGADLGAAGLLAIVVVGYATGPVIIARSLSDLPGLGVVAASLAACAIGYAPAAILQRPAHLPPATGIASVIVLGVLCTAIGFVLFFELITEIGALRSTVITYVNPAVAVALGVAFLHESFTLGTAVGFGLILAGSILATGWRRIDDPSGLLEEVAKP